MKIEMLGEYLAYAKHRLPPGLTALFAEEISMTKKLYAFGMDGLITPMVKKFIAEGCLPNFERLLREGTVNQTFPSFPVWTPTNWATLSTGAHTGTHGVTRWRVEVEPGRRIDSFSGPAPNADRIWNALERAGLRSVAVHYPAAHPSGIQSGFVVDGFGHPGYGHTDYEVAPAQSYTTAADESACPWIMMEPQSARPS